MAEHDGDSMETFVHQGVSDNDNKCAVCRMITLTSIDFLRRIIVSDTEAGSLILSYVCPPSVLFPIEDFIWRVTEEHGEDNKMKGSAKVVCSVWSTVRLARSEQGTDDPGK